jgi:hypothetical protein
MEYLRTFSWQLPSKNEFAYSHVTFEAAIGFINHFSYSVQKQAQEREREQVPLNCSADSGSDSPSATNSSPSTSASASTSSTASSSQTLGRHHSQIDRELEHITRLIGRDNSELASESTLVFHDKGPLDDDLGEFLSSLRNNQFLVGCGKQS